MLAVTSKPQVAAYGLLRGSAVASGIWVSGPHSQYGTLDCRAEHFYYVSSQMHTR